MQQKFEVAVNLAQDFTDAQKAQARANIGCANLITITTASVEQHTVTATESTNGHIELEIPLSDITFQSGHQMSISDFLSKPGLSFIRFAIRAYDNASMDLINDGTPIGIKLAINDIQYSIYTVDTLHKVTYVFNTLADILFKDFDYYMPPYNSPFVKLIIHIDFPNNAIPSGVKLEYDFDWGRITD